MLFLFLLESFDGPLPKATINTDGSPENFIHKHFRGITLTPSPNPPSFL